MTKAQTQALTALLGAGAVVLAAGIYALAVLLAAPPGSWAGPPDAVAAAYDAPASIPATLGAPAPAATVRVATAYANLARAPGQAAAEKTPPHLIRGDFASVLGIADGWVRVAYPDADHAKEVGWLDSAGLAGSVATVSGAPTAKAFLLPEANAPSEPGTPFVLGGQQVTELATRDGWSLVLYDPSNTLGWLATPSLKKSL